MTTPISFGIVGTGRMAATMARSLMGVPGVTVHAVASRAIDRAQDFSRDFSIPKACGSLREICGDPEIDVLYVANATEHHAATCVEILEAGKSVLCEKPFALSAAEARRVADAASHSGCFFMEALWPLFLPTFSQLRTVAEDNTLGQPQLLRFEFGYPVHEVDRAGLIAPKRGGILFDRGCYGVALAIWLFGPAGRMEFREFGAGGGVSLRLLHDVGVLSEIAVSADCLLSNSVSLACTRGLVTLGPPSLAAEGIRIQKMMPTGLQDGRKLDFRYRLRSLPAARRLRRWLGGGVGRQEWLSYGNDPYAPMVQHVRDCLSAGLKESPLLPIKMSVRTIEVLASAGWNAGDHQ